MCSVVSQYRCSVKKRYKKTQSSSDYANSTSVAFSKLHSAMTSVTLIAYIQVLIQWIGTQPKSDPFVNQGKPGKPGAKGSRGLPGKRGLEGQEGAPGDQGEKQFPDY